jgi:hypothetical protein
VTMFSDQSNIEENHHQITTGGDDRFKVASSSYESRDSTMSLSDSSDNTERALTKSRHPLRLRRITFPLPAPPCRQHVL